MLKNRAFISILRQQPLQACAKPYTYPIRLLNRSRLQKRFITSTRPLPKRPSLPSWRVSLSQRIRSLRRSSDKSTPPAAQEHGSQQAQSVSGRFKELSRKYGWAAVGVYFGLSVLDFPFCFLAVRLVGPDRIGELEHAVVDRFWNFVAVIMPSMKAENRMPVEVEVVEAEARESMQINGNGHKHKEQASIWTQLLLAYGVHKSLIFFRVPLAGAVTPKVVKTLRSWGWNVGNRKARTVR